MKDSGDPQEQDRRDRWIPVAFVMFFLLLAVFQGWFVFLAQSSFSGLVTDRVWNGPTNAARGMQPLTGVVAGFRFAPTGALSGRVYLSLQDEGGKPLTADHVRGSAERGTRFPQSLPVVFRPVELGLYTAEITLPLAGGWSFRTLIDRDGRTLERVDAVEIEP